MELLKFFPVRRALLDEIIAGDAGIENVVARKESLEESGNSLVIVHAVSESDGITEDGNERFFWV